MGVDHQLLHLIAAFDSFSPGGIADLIIDTAATNGSMTILMTRRDDALRVVMGAAQRTPRVHERLRTERERGS